MSVYPLVSAFSLLMAPAIGLQLILDVDTGSDDAEAILLAASPHSNASIPAMTTATGNAALVNTTRNTLKTLEVAGRPEIEVFPGAEQGLVFRYEIEDYFGPDGFGGMDPDKKPPFSAAQKQHAALAMVRVINENPGEVTLVCLAPLTNLAIALHLDPELLNKTKAVFIMGGSFKGDIEFNVKADPEAAAFVFSKATEDKPINVFPHDVAKKYPFSLDWRLNVLGKLGSKVIELMNFIDQPILKGETWTPDDALTTACVLEPSIIVSSQPYFANVTTCGEQRGLLVVDPDKPANLNVITDIDIKKMEDVFLSYLNY